MLRGEFDHVAAVHAPRQDLSSERRAFTTDAQEYGGPGCGPCPVPAHSNIDSNIRIEYWSHRTGQKLRLSLCLFHMHKKHTHRLKHPLETGSPSRDPLSAYHHLFGLWQAPNLILIVLPLDMGAGGKTLRASDKVVSEELSMGHGVGQARMRRSKACLGSGAHHGRVPSHRKGLRRHATP